MSHMEEPNLEEARKAIALTRLHDEVFGKIAAILKCSPRDVHQKLQKWTEQTRDIVAVLDYYEAESAKIGTLDPEIKNTKSWTACVRCKGTDPGPDGWTFVVNYGNVCDLCMDAIAEGLLENSKDDEAKKG